MDPNTHIIEPSALVTGDILLCVGQDRQAARVTRETKSKYTHSAICYSPGEIAHISSKVEKVPTDDFIKKFAYIAAFRGPNFWGDERLNMLRAFIDRKMGSNITYDMEAARSLMKRKKVHQIESQEKLINHFVNGVPEPEHDKEKYVCSEIVTAVLIEAGIWGEGLATAYEPNTLHPGNQGHDPSFGFLFGYLRADPTTKIPADDEFACSMTNQMTYSEWQAAFADLISNPPQTGQELSEGEIQSLLQSLSNNADANP
jgi:hypothetical protein